MVRVCVMCRERRGCRMHRMVRICRKRRMVRVCVMCRERRGCRMHRMVRICR